MSVGNRIFLAIVAIQLASAAVVIGWYFYSLQSELAGFRRQAAEEVVLRSIEATQQFFEPSEAVAEAGRRLLTGGVLAPERPEQLERYLAEQLRQHPQIAGLYLGYPDGGFLYVMRSDEAGAGGTRTKIIRQGAQGREVELVWRDRDFLEVRRASDPADSFDPRTRPWYDGASRQQGGFWTAPYVFFTVREPGVTLAWAVPAADGSLAAVLGVDIEVSEISGFLTRNSLALGGSAFIATAAGEVIAHSGIGLVLPDAAAGSDSLRLRTVAELPGAEGLLGQRILARSAEQPGDGWAGVWEESAEDADFFVAAGRMADPQRPWLIGAIMPQAGRTEVASGSDWGLIGVILLATGLASLVGYVLSRRVGGALATLHDNALLARKGNVEVMDPLATGYKEIDETAVVLVEMAEQQRRR